MLNILHGALSLAIQDGDAAAETAEQVAETAAAASGGGSVVVGFLVAIAVLVAPFVIGHFLAKALKVSEWAGRIGFTLLAVTLAALPLVFNVVGGTPLTEMMRLGIDLAGGTNMVFQVEEQEGKEITNEVMDNMVGAVAKRINPDGLQEITVRQVGQTRIEVIVPGEDPQTVNEIKRRITKLGSLEFFITASPQEDAALAQTARALSNEEKKILDSNGAEIARWVPAFMKNGEPKLLSPANYVSRPIDVKAVVDGEEKRVQSAEYLVLVDPPGQRVTGKYLTGVSEGMNERGATTVNFRLNQAGGFLMETMTGPHAPEPGRPTRHMSIVLDGRLYSAPALNSMLSTSVQIEGSFTRQEINELMDVLNAGALEVPIRPEPLSEATVDPTLGEDVRNKGFTAILIASIAVVLFMIFYYRFAGIVAVICLVLNLLLVLAMMIAIKATFTLPGLAGLVLTIGMAVDANVLIFERIREEQKRGSSPKNCIQNGFGKAFSTIIDANVTTLLTAIVLYSIGTDQVRGFAVSLFIGIVMSMFTALFVGRLIFDIAERRRWISRIGMFSLVGETNWDFLGKRKLCAMLSLALVAGGLAAFSARGEGNYDIDFTGGTMVSFQFTEAQDTDAVSEILKTQFGDEFTLERLTLDEAEATSGSRHFRLRTTKSAQKEAEGEGDEQAESVSDEAYVGGLVRDAFSGNTDMQLRRVTMEYDEVVPFEIAEDDESVEALTYARFNGGNTCTVTFSEAIAEGTVTDQLKRSLMALADNEEKYTNAEVMFGIEGVGDDAAANQLAVKRFPSFVLRTTTDIPAEDLTAALTAMQTEMSESPLFDELNTFASAVAGEMKTKAILAILLSLIAIVAYIWFRFQSVTFGFAAVAALVHDVLVVLGAVAVSSFLSGNAIGDLFLITDLRINLPMVAAFLTIVGYSLNDTIVVFDRIREVRGKAPELTVDMLNTSLNQTLARTLLTSITTLIVVLILYVIGGEGIHGFAFCLTAGVMVGTYSSIYVASPVLLWLMNREKNKGNTAA